MKQECVVLHTNKDLMQTEEILKEKGFEIVFKSQSVILPISELTKEELECWQEFLGKELNKFLKTCYKQEKYIEKFRETRKIINEQLKKFVDSFNRNPKSSETTIAYAWLTNKLNEIAHTNFYAGDFRDMTSLHYDIPELRETNCYCLVAKKDSNVVRYLGFRAFPDPIITFSGPEANILKSTLEKQF